MTESSMDAWIRELMQRERFGLDEGDRRAESPRHIEHEQGDRPTESAPHMENARAENPRHPESPPHVQGPRDGDTSYWERLREPRALVERDIALVRRVPRRRPVVDVGCGNGGFVRACTTRGIEALGVEAFAGSVAVAAAHGAPVLRGAGEGLPFVTDALDVVRLKEVLEHVQQPLVMAREMRRVLRRGGVLIAYVPTQWSQLYPFPANFWDDYTHVRAFSRTGLARLLEDAGFSWMEIRGYTPPLRWWQLPIATAASKTAPFLWRAVAVNGAGHA